MSELTLMPAFELAAMIQRKEVGAEELLDLHLARYQRFNSQLNAVVFCQFDKARDRARAADDALARGEIWGPLHGLPMTVKDSFDWVGSPSTWGIPSLRDNYPQRDAVVVERLETAGAVIYGKTNVPLKLGDWQSFNEIYGTTNNPWDPSRSPGGSSGGAAVALATGMASLEIGSDIGASIRNPAHYCGVFGHKPTLGIVPLHGHQLPDDYTFFDILVGGPLARTAADLTVALNVLAGAAGPDRPGWRLELPPPRKSRLADFKVGVMLESPACVQDRTLTEQLEVTVDALDRAGVQIDRSARPNIDMERCQHVYMMLLRAALGTSVSDEEFEAKCKGARSRKPDDRSCRAYMERGASIYHRDWWRLHNEREAMRIRWAEFFDDYDLLLCPAAASTAFPHDHSGERADRTIEINGRQESTTDQLFWAGLSGLVYLPSTVAPAGLTRSGLPCGLQIVAGYIEDLTALEFARLMEQELGGFQVVPGYE